MRELSLDEMDKVASGKRHFEPLPDRVGWTQHKVAPTDTSGSGNNPSERKN